LVASWVRDETELLWLAPGTAWPLTADKVCGWTGPTDRPVLLFEGAQSIPSGYAELNPLRESKTQLWIGHLIIAPARRRRGLGRRFTRMLVEDAFSDPRAERVVMIVFPENQPALRCYESVGFRVIRTEQHRFPPHQQERSLLRLEITRAEASYMSSGPAAQELPT
jgi:GNAT superfamily N-acetyltransferase